MWRSLSIGILCAAALAGADSKLELRGRVAGLTSRPRIVAVKLFSINFPFAETILSDPGGAFHFRSLPAGTYVVTILRGTLGEIHRTVVVTPSLADRKGVVRVTIPYSLAEAMASRSAGTISKKTLAVPGRAWSRYEDAQRKLSKRDVEGARQSLEKAVEIAPKFYEAWNSLGVISYQTQDFVRAEGCFRKALEVAPESFEAMVNLGGILLTSGRAEEALLLNRQAVESRPLDALANSQLGLAYFQLGDFEKAEAPLLAAWHEDPAHFSHPQLFLAAINLKRGNRDAAVADLEDFITRNPDEPSAARLRRQIVELGAR